MASEEQIDYAHLVEGALLDVVREILTRVVDDGLPGEHYFYLTFRTDADGVEMPEYLRTRYPEEMTVILQHQFWDLEVDRERFAVSLSFGGARRRLVVPWPALVSFVDPAARFGLRFGEQRTAAAGEAAPGGQDGAGETPSAEGAEILSFDRFRKKRDG